MLPSVDALIALALEEDLGRGDVTSEVIFEPNTPASGRIIAKESLVVAGVDVAREVFLRVDARTRCDLLVADGQRLQKGEAVAQVAGTARSLLSAERTALNFLQRLSGIATLTRKFADAVAGTRA